MITQEDVELRAKGVLENYSELDVIVNGRRYIPESRALSKQQVREAIRKVGEQWKDLPGCHPHLRTLCEVLEL